MKEQVLFLHFLNKFKLESEKNYLEELNALKKEYEEFVYIVSHDLKSPMRAINNITTWIEEDLENIEDKGVLENFGLLKNRVVRLENMMNSLLELSRVSRFEMEVYEVNIPHLINECVEMAIGNSGANFHLDIAIESETITTLGKKLQKVILSLFDNAIRFHDKEKKDIFVAIKETRDYFEFSVRDNGPGIPDDVKEKIFSIFYTVNSKDRVHTTGAGLAITAKIIKMVGGTLSCFDAKDGGSIFEFTWPKVTLI